MGGGKLTGTMRHLDSHKEFIHDTMLPFHRACFCSNPNCGREGRCLGNKGGTEKWDYFGPPIYGPTQPITPKMIDEVFEKLMNTPTDEIKYAVFAYGNGPKWEAVSDFLYDTFEEAVQAAEKDYQTWPETTKVQILSTCAYVERPAPVVRRVIN